MLVRRLLNTLGIRLVSRFFFFFICVPFPVKDDLNSIEILEEESTTTIIWHTRTLIVALPAQNTSPSRRSNRRLGALVGFAHRSCVHMDGAGPGRARLRNSASIIGCYAAAVTATPTNYKPRCLSATRASAQRNRLLNGSRYTILHSPKLRRDQSAIRRRQLDQRKEIGRRGGGHSH